MITALYPEKRLCHNNNHKYPFTAYAPEVDEEEFVTTKKLAIHPMKHSNPDLRASCIAC